MKLSPGYYWKPLYELTQLKSERCHCDLCGRETRAEFRFEWLHNTVFRRRYYLSNAR